MDGWSWRWINKSRLSPQSWQQRSWVGGQSSQFSPVVTDNGSWLKEEICKHLKWAYYIGWQGSTLENKWDTSLFGGDWSKVAVHHIERSCWKCCRHQISLPSFGGCLGISHWWSWERSSCWRKYYISGLTMCWTIPRGAGGVSTGGEVWILLMDLKFLWPDNI